MWGILTVFNLIVFLIIAVREDFPTKDSIHWLEKLHFVWIVLVGILLSFFSVDSCCVLVGWNHEFKNRMIFHHMAFFSMLFWICVFFFMAYLFEEVYK